jgi:DNA-binding response OmpR family regulator
MDTVVKILVVEDDDDLRLLLTKQLRANGYTVVHAVDAVGAVSVGRLEQPDLVLLDMMLPGGDGALVLQRYSNLAVMCGVPVVVLTGQDLASVEARVRPFHVAGCIRKPVEGAELLQAIQRALRGHSIHGSDDHDSQPAQAARLAAVAQFSDSTILRAVDRPSWVEPTPMRWHG